MLLPMMMTLFLGSVEISTAVAIHRKVTLTARALADLSSQFTSITNADMTNILNASAASSRLTPRPSSNRWCRSSRSTPRQGHRGLERHAQRHGAHGRTVVTSGQSAVPNTYLMLGEAAYSYNAVLRLCRHRHATLSDQIYMRPRQSNSVSRNAS